MSTIFIENETKVKIVLVISYFPFFIKKRKKLRNDLKTFLILTEMECIQKTMQ